MNFANYPPPNQEIANAVCQLLLIRPDFYLRVRQLMDSMELYLPTASTANVNCENISDTDETVDDRDWSLRDVLSRINKTWSKSKIRALNEKHTSTIDIRLESEYGDKKRMKILAPPTVDQSIDESGRQQQVLTDYTGETDGGFGQLFPRQISVDNVQLFSDVEKPFDFTTAYSLDEIHKNCLSSEDMKADKLFQNYKKGDPSARLYVKNISKHCDVLELKRLFAGFIDCSEESRLDFAVHLMTRGKLRGQAFVFLVSIEAAKNALEQTNGFLLHDKPIVVSYARSQQIK